MKYNLYIYGKVYRGKTVSEILELIKPYRERIDTDYYTRMYGIEYEIKRLKESISRIAFYNFTGKVIVSLNRVNQKRGK